MKAERTAANSQKKFDFSAPRPRPFLSSLPAKIDSYEEGVARFFQWRTGLDYYATIDQIVDFIVNTRRGKIVDLLGDTAALALRLAGRKGFQGKIQSFDNNITLLERARQRARHLNLLPLVEFRQLDGVGWPISDGFAEVAVSIFDFHRHQPEGFLNEAYRILAPEGYLIVGEVLVPQCLRNRIRAFFRGWHLRLVQHNPLEAQGVFLDQDEIIELIFKAGFRQVVIQGLKSRPSLHHEAFCLIAATK